MPATAPPISPTVAAQLRDLGGRVRARRKALKVSGAAAAEAAGMSRVTLYRIEKGEPSVTMGAYCSAMAALGLELAVGLSAASPTTPEPDRQGWIPARIPLADYAQLRQLAWQVHGTDALTPGEAMDIYERNERHLDRLAMAPAEQQLLDALRLAFGKGRGDV